MARAWGVMSKPAMAVAVLLALLAVSVPRSDALEVETVATLADGAEAAELASTAARIQRDLATPNSVASMVAKMLKEARQKAVSPPDGSPPDGSVLVVGAGPAGLLSTLQAYTAGYAKITVIEGRDWNTPSRHHVLRNIGKLSLPFALMAAAGKNIHEVPDTLLGDLWGEWETALKLAGGNVLTAYNQREKDVSHSTRLRIALLANAFYSEYMAGMMAATTEPHHGHGFTSINVFEASMRAFVKGLDSTVITTHGKHYFHGVCPVPAKVEGLPLTHNGKHVAVVFEKKHENKFDCSSAAFAYDTTTNSLTVKDEDKDTAATFLADLIIGADGAWSAVRYHMWGDKVDFYVPNARANGDANDWFPHYVKAVFKVDDADVMKDFGALTGCNSKFHTIQQWDIPEVQTSAGTVPAHVVDESFESRHGFDGVAGLFARYHDGKHSVINLVLGKYDGAGLPRGISSAKMAKTVQSLRSNLNGAFQECNPNINLGYADLMDVSGKKELLGFAMSIYHVDKPVKTLNGVTYLLVGDSQMTSNFKKGASVTEVARTMESLYAEMRRLRTNSGGNALFKGALEWEDLLCTYTKNNEGACTALKDVTTKKSHAFRTLNLGK